MNRPTIQIHNAATGENIIREMNDDEYAEWLSEAPKREQAASESARSIRNQKLKDSDWTQLSDSPSQNKLAWATYRQALRDVPQQSGFPTMIDWPVAPS